MSATATWPDVLEGRARWCVVHADNAAVLPLLSDKSVAHVICDPPYEAEAHTKQRRIFNDGADRGGGIREAPLSFDALSSADRLAFAQHAARISAGWILAFCQIESVGAWRTGLVTAGAKWRRGMVWRKPNGQPQMSGDRPGMGFECMALAWAGGGRSSWNGGGRHGFFEHAVDANFSAEPRWHESQKPLPLMLEIVELLTAPSDIVLDPFAGSSSTGVACLRLGRRFVGIEREQRWADVSRERLEAESLGLSLRDARAGQIPLFGGAL